MVIKMNFNKLSIEEKFGQMILLGLDVYDINEEIIELIQKYKIGGVVLYKKNYISYESMINVINKLKNANKGNKVPLFIGIEQENGRVNRLPKDIIRIKSVYKQAKTNNMKVINSINEITTYMLKSAGVNLNFAPVIDIKSDKNKVIGNRSYGDNSKEVIKYGIPLMKTLQENNIISVIKYFPKIGATNRDNFLFLPKTKITSEEMKVLGESINLGADAIMVSHIKVNGYGLKPASINKKLIKEELINKYNYNGLLITDDLRINALKNFYGVKRCIKKSIEAGINIQFIKYKKNDKNKLFKDLLKMVKYFEIDIDLINESAKKIVDYKNKYNINDNMISTSIELNMINDKIKKINNYIEKELF